MFDIETVTTMQPAKPVAEGISSLMNGLTRYISQKDQEQTYKDNVYEIFHAIGSTLEKYPKRMLVTDAAHHVISRIANRPDNIEPIVSFQTSLPEIMNVARGYQPQTDDEFNPFHATFMEFVSIHDAYFKHVKNTMSHLSIKEDSIEKFSLVQSAESWGEHHQQQINFRACEIRGLIL